MTTPEMEIGARLQSARRAAGLTQTEAGARMGMLTSTVSAIEAGKREIGGRELYELARLYGRPLEFFLGAATASESPGFLYLFRQAEEKILDRDSLKELEQLAADYQLVEELVGATPLAMPTDYSKLPSHTAAHAESLAEMERGRLGLGDGPVGDLATILDEQVGARVFLLPVANQSWSGVVVRDTSGRPCVAVNSREEFYRRNYDLAHEYGHALVHLGGNRPEGKLDLRLEESQPAPEERFADAFAAAFLMPRRAVAQQVDQALRASGGNFTDRDLVRLAMYFGVSGQALSLRLVWLHHMPRAAHDRLWKDTKSFKALAKSLGYDVEAEGEPWLLPVVLPRRYRYLALKAYERDIISVSRLAELLREDPYELRRNLEEVLVDSREAV